MVRTLSDLKGVRVSGKAPRKLPVSTNSGSAGRSTKKYNGMNSYCPREVPSWQKQITNFFPSKSDDTSNEHSTVEEDPSLTGESVKSKDSQSESKE